MVAAKWQNGTAGQEIIINSPNELKSMWEPVRDEIGRIYKPDSNEIAADNLTVFAAYGYGRFLEIDGVIYDAYQVATSNNNVNSFRPSISETRTKFPVKFNTFRY